MKDLYWTQKDGIKILVNDMTENHVKNVLRMIIRINSEKNDELRDLYHEFQAENYGDR